jgi:hypothetical protein
MKWLYLVAIVFTGFKLSGQSPIELDKEKGFKEYAIGTKLPTIKKKLKILDEGYQTKLFKAKEKAEINGMKGGEIELAFYEDRLVEITVVFHRKTMKEYDSLKHSLEHLYGTPKDKSYSKKEPSYLTTNDEIFEWEGLVMGLQYNYDVSHKVIEIIYWGLREKTQKSIEEVLIYLLLTNA